MAYEMKPLSCDLDFATAPVFVINGLKREELHARLHQAHAR
jgi:hypothetical protein